MPCEMIQAEEANFSITMMCGLLGCSRSGYYAQKNRTPSARHRQDGLLKRVIRKSFFDSRKTYGSPRILSDIKELGFHTSRRRVARLMREEGLLAAPRKRFKVTTHSEHSLDIAKNIIDREFSIKTPDTVWATDITYVRTWEGWLYLAVVVDLFSRRIVGWSMATHMRTELALGALNMALGRRSPAHKMHHHSDRGSQYASHDYRNALSANNIVCSMSRKGNCWDNAVVESFFASLKKELVYRKPWATTRRSRMAIVEYIEVFYNRKRKHSTLGYLSPEEFERNYHKHAAEASLAA